MQYINIGNRSEKVSLSEAIFKSLAADGSLYMPEEIPMLGKTFFESMEGMSLPQIAFEVLKPYMQPEMGDEVLKDIVKQTFSFPIPLVSLNDNLHVLELFHGPTQAFKDVGARFLSRVMSYLQPVSIDKLVVLTATSGDTGGAVANGFHNVPGIEVVVLYPKNKITPYQLQQITEPGDNIHPLEVEGSFDDCQRLVKQAFNDKALRAQRTLTSANSINIGRLLPQMVYYFWGAARFQLHSGAGKPVICVPSGNFGNLTAAVMAHHMGLPVARFIAATNANDVVPRFFKSGRYEPGPTVVTVANAMDVGDPSNFSRLIALFKDDIEVLHKLMTAKSMNDLQIRKTIQDVYAQFEYLLDPHTAAAFRVLDEALSPGEKGFIVATAHPRKFVEVLEPLLPGVSTRLKKDFGVNFAVIKKYQTLKNSYNSLRSYLIDSF